MRLAVSNAGDEITWRIMPAREAVAKKDHAPQSG